ADATATKTIASLRLQPSACNTNQRGLSSVLLLRLVLRTDFHLLVAISGMQRLLIHSFQPSFARAFAVEGQADRDLGTLPNSARDVQATAMQRQQPLHDR